MSRRGRIIAAVVAAGLLAGLLAWGLWPRGDADRPAGGGKPPAVAGAREAGPGESPSPSALASRERDAADADSDGDGLPDAWEMKYFGHLDHGPNDSPAGDGVPNVFKYHAGLNPNVKWTRPGDQPRFSVHVPGHAKVRYDSRAAAREQVNRRGPASQPDGGGAGSADGR